MPKHVTITNTEYVDLTDNGATTIHKHDHGGQDGLTDDDHTQYINTSPSAIGRNTITIPNATYKGLVIKGYTAQSANLQEWNNVSDTVLTYVDSSGNISVGGVGTIPTAGGQVYVNKNGAAAGFTVHRTDGKYAKLSAGTLGSALTFQNGVYFNVGEHTAAQDINIGASGDTYFTVNTGGNVAIGINTGGLPIAAFTNTKFQVSSTNANLVMGVFRGASGQNANLMEWQNSSGTVLGAVQARGTYYTNIGTENLFIGKGAGNTATTGDGLIAIGDLAGANVGTNRFSIAIGYKALNAKASGNQDTVIGYEAGLSWTGAQGTAIGYHAMRNFTTLGVGNVAIGAQAMLGGNTNYGVAIGNEAGKTGALRCMFIGTNAGEFQGATNGDSVAIGYYAMNRPIGGSNIFIGTSSGRGTASSTAACERNFGAGTESFYSITTGARNWGAGYQTGYNITTGSRNIFIGYSAGYQQTTNSDLLIVDNRQRADVATEASNALLYGVMADNPTDQTLDINARVKTRGRRQNVSVQSGNYTLTDNDEVVVFTASATATLPAATGTGQTYRIVCRSGILTIDANGSETIKAELTQTLTAGEDLIISDTASGIWE